MISKELIKAEIERVPEERLDRLYSVVKEFARRSSHNGGPSLMSKLKDVTIDGPEDFAENIDLYLSGDKALG
ncbi:MAG: hypothetical protein WAQ99_14475 [Pyrinomonadaceae bacterium]